MADTGQRELILSTKKDTCEWLSDVLHLVPLEPRPDGYDPLKEMHLEKVLSGNSERQETCAGKQSLIKIFLNLENL